MATLINGTKIALELKNEIAKKVQNIIQKYNVTPSITTIIVGDNEASIMYVNKKYEEATKIGINAKIIRLSKNITDEEIRDIIFKLNADNYVHAILLQLPLPTHLDKFRVINYIDSKKDVDGLTTINAGKISTNNLQNALIPCTPQGCIALAKSVISDFIGKNVLVVGKSNLVGKPLADMLLNMGCTVTIAHKNTLNLLQYSKTADIIFVAAGSPNLITGDMLKKDAVIIDVGISRINGKIVGDCNYESCNKIASFITPVPGGVGPMTIAYLLFNTILCCENSLV